jgi:hypothetical protein
MTSTVVVVAPGCCGASPVTTAPGAAATLLEQTGRSPRTGPTPAADDPASQPRTAAAGEAAGLLDPLHDTAHVLTHAGGIQTGA